jgi:hypothetical protein
VSGFVAIHVRLAWRWLRIVPRRRERGRAFCQWLLVTLRHGPPRLHQRLELSEQTGRLVWAGCLERIGIEGRTSFVDAIGQGIHHARRAAGIDHVGGREGRHLRLDAFDTHSIGVM